MNCPTRVHDELHEDATLQTKAITQWTQAYVPCLCDVCVYCCQKSVQYTVTAACWCYERNKRSSLAGQMLQNHLPTATTSPSVSKEKVNSYISASVQTDKYAGIVCPSRSRSSLRESSSVASQMRLPLWRHRAAAINRTRVRFHSGKQGASYVLWAKEEHQPASWTLIFNQTQSETRSFRLRNVLKVS